MMWLLILAASLALSMPAMALTSQTYTSLCSTPQSGDVAGWEVILSQRQKGYEVSFGYSEGQLMEPVTASWVSYDPASRHLKFRVRIPEGLVKFDGIAGKTNLAGRLSDSAISSDEEVILRAVPASWDVGQAFPNCANGK